MLWLLISFAPLCYAVIINIPSDGVIGVDFMSVTVSGAFLNTFPWRLIARLLLGTIDIPGWKWELSFRDRQVNNVVCFFWGELCPKRETFKQSELEASVKRESSVWVTFLECASISAGKKVNDVIARFESRPPVYYETWSLHGPTVCYSGSEWANHVTVCSLHRFHRYLSPGLLQRSSDWFHKQLP